MGLSPVIRARLAQEGLEQIANFVDFKEEQLKDAFKNMRTAIPGIPATAEVQDNNGQVIQAAVAGVAAIPPVLVPANCSLRLRVASIAYHYYLSISREPTAANMNYALVLMSFYEEWEALLESIKNDPPEVPLLLKTTTPLKWMESFKECCYGTFGIRKTPLSYLLRDESNVPAEADDPLQQRRSFGKSDSVVDELIARLGHDGGLYKQDNAKLYGMLELATRGTIYAPTVTSHSRKKDGRSAWMQMLSSHAGTEKWEKLYKDKSNFLMNTKWNGKNYPLEKFTSLHRNAFVSMTESSSHVTVQLPTEHSRVGYLLDNITSTDPELMAAIASIKIPANQMRDNFEDAVNFILPTDPYVRNNNRSNRNNFARISDTRALRNSQDSRTGVDLRWHTRSEYVKLNAEQRQELYEWQQTNTDEFEKSRQDSKQSSPKRGKGRESHNDKYTKRLKGEISKLHAKNKEMTTSKDPSIEDLQACFEPFVAATQGTAQTNTGTGQTPPVDPRVAAAAVRLKGILKRSGPAKK